MQAMLQIATAHGASLDQHLPLNTAYICWQVARHEQLACVLSMLGSVIGMPSLQSGFKAALAHLGKCSSAATLPDLIEVRMNRTHTNTQGVLVTNLSVAETRLLTLPHQQCLCCQTA